MTVSESSEATCGAWGGCTLPYAHNMGQADIPENHQPMSAGQQLAAHLADQRLSVIQEAFRILGWPLRFEITETDKK